jgi:hypothetical protein
MNSFWLGLTKTSTVALPRVMMSNMAMAGSPLLSPLMAY